MNNAVRYQVMPPLSSDEYQELFESIKTEGVLEPIHVDEEGVVIDGHHRSKIASELGVPCPVITHDDLSESGKRSLAFTLNLKRRHLNREQRRALGLESLRLDPIVSNREHSKRTGLDHKTIQSIRQDQGIPEPKEVIRDYAEAHPDKPDHVVGAELGVSKNTVAKYRDCQNGEIPHFDNSPTATAIPQSELDELNTPSPFVDPCEKIPETSYTTKDFPETEEPTPRAEPITTQLSKAIIELNKAMNRIHRIVEDPNFHRNKQTAWSLHGNDIIRTIDELETIVNNMK